MNEFLRDDELSWGIGFASFIPTVSTRKIAEQIARNFLSDNRVLHAAPNGAHRFVIDMESSDMSYISLLLAAGRAIGLSVRYGANLGFLQLDGNVVKLLNSRIRMTFSLMDANQVAADVGLGEKTDEFLMSITIVSAGIDEALGPGGLELLSDVDWMSHFSTSDS